MCKHFVANRVYKRLMHPQEGSALLREQYNIVKDDIYISNEDGMKFLNTIENNSIDLILTDPPYIIFKESGRQ